MTDESESARTVCLNEEVEARETEMSERERTILKLTDINIDCLEKIFSNLNLRDLLNVADSNKSLKQAVDLVYSRRFGPKTIFFRVIFKLSRDSIEMSHQKIEFNDLRTALQLIRCFGHLISKLEYDHSIDTYPKHRNEVDRYINEYCANSLSELQFFTTSKDVFERLEKPFLNVKTVCFNYCSLGKFS